MHATPQLLHRTHTSIHTQNRTKVASTLFFSNVPCISRGTCFNFKPIVFWYFEHMCTEPIKPGMSTATIDNSKCCFYAIINCVYLNSATLYMAAFIQWHCAYLLYWNAFALLLLNKSCMSNCVDNFSIV